MAERERTVESLGLMPSFWSGRRVFLTGHTGFKGAWLAYWLGEMGARVCGYGLAPDTEPSLFAQLDLGARLDRHVIADIRDRAALGAAIADARPGVVFHMAAQPLVRRSYRDPLETFETNVMGTVNLLDALRGADQVAAIVVITSDKCYQQRGGSAPFREDDWLGGRDPYSASKACQDIAAAAMADSFFQHGALVATVRAGNVLGGGDRAEDRLIPDIVRAVEANEPLTLRYPDAVRPWQFVLDPLAGYLALAERLAGGQRTLAGSWNFAPPAKSAVPVRILAERFMESFGAAFAIEFAAGEPDHETQTLQLDASKARHELGWWPRCDLAATIDETARWYAAVANGTAAAEACRRSLASYLDRPALD